MEVYRFSWLEAFGEHAIIYFARHGDEILLDRSYYEAMFNDAERFAAVLPQTNWQRLLHVLSAANFRSLPPEVFTSGILDGYELIVEAGVARCSGRRSSSIPMWRNFGNSVASRLISPASPMCISEAPLRQRFEPTGNGSRRRQTK